MLASLIRASPASARPGRSARSVAYRRAEPLPRFSCSLGTAPSWVPAENTHRPGWHRASDVELAGCSRSTISQRSRAGRFRREWGPGRPTARGHILVSDGALGWRASLTSAGRRLRAHLPDEQEMNKAWSPAEAQPSTLHASPSFARPTSSRAIANDFSSASVVRAARRRMRRSIS